MTVPVSEINIDLRRDALLTSQAIETLSDRYMVEGETSPQHAFARACAAFADDAEHGQRLYDYVSQQWFMFATPVLSNGGTNRGLPISCYLNFVPDSRRGLSDHYDENIWLASNGGGIGGYWGAVRSSGVKSGGSMPFAKVVDAQMLAFNQGRTRRGSYAAYMNISHPEVEEWLEMRKASGGDANRKCLNLHHGLNITDEFMEAVRDNKDFDLIDPHSKEVRKTLNARKFFTKILEVRHQTGEPYLFFIDEANRQLPEPLKKRGYKINASNLCTEITLPTSPDRTAVCCLSSVNLAKFDDWGDHPHFIEDLMRMLDNVLTDFINRAPSELHRAVASAVAERSVGLGALGFHTFLQEKNIPFESDLARGYNLQMFDNINTKSLAASRKLAKERGPAPEMLEEGLRFAHRLAIAPNASSSIFAGCSPSVEPINTNAYLHKTLTGSHPVKNASLEKLLESLGHNTQQVWSDIIADKGSVQHLDFLTEKQKAIFKTSREIDQHWIITHAADRQPFICQAQSINLFFDSTVDAAYLVSVHFAAWSKKLKSLYYLRATSGRKAENTNTKVERQIREEVPEPEECIACEG